MKEYVLMMLVTVMAVHLFWIVPISNAIRVSKKIIANLNFTREEEKTDGNNAEKTDSGV